MEAKTTREITEKARDVLFIKAKENVHDKIKSKAEEGSSYLKISFNEYIRRDDISLFKNELEGLGYKVNIDYGIEDKLEITW